MNPIVCLVKVRTPLDDRIINFLIPFSPHEKQHRILRQRKKRTADIMVVGGALVRHMLWEQFSIPLDTKISYGEYGKPYLPDFPYVHFNISHSGRYVACAVCDWPVGIDIQVIRPYYPAVARRVYKPEELEQIKNSADPAAEFTKLWTKKEAYLKMLGCGLITDIKTTVCSTPSQMKTLKYENAYLSYISAGNEDVSNLQYY